MKELIYKPLPDCVLQQAKDILCNGTREQLAVLPLSVGTSDINWKDAQNICVTLLSNPDAAIRANAALGLAYIARTKRMLDKRTVKPYLLKELRENKEYRWRIIDAIEDINIFLGWHLAEKAMQKLENA
ncbi:MAG: hypothetical protein LBG82_01660 [Clostridiales Family XIII bacterium]|jgi:hypothetical protein|nr:hypothetical protein [Clostridiales Family XIII bacterium]